MGQLEYVLSTMKLVFMICDHSEMTEGSGVVVPEYLTEPPYASF